jgi:predicted unusual protein kinase regulating ubiquinone biosynthesis (AarF/ABC1/UbiB family)
MKAGQLVSFIVEALPPEAQRALATLQSDAPPMAPALAAGVVERELGAPPERVFLDWQPLPAAAASIGQVHRAVLHDGRRAAVKVQYPGVDAAIEADLDNVDVLYALFSAFAAKGLDSKSLVNELRERLHDELDYALEARHQREFATYFAGHPFVTIPAVIEQLSTGRVLTSEWAEGLSWNEFVAGADHAAKQRTGEVIWRFAQHAVHRLGAFNGDPHPGNYRFTRHGDVTFLDFGLVKRWSPGDWERLAPTLDAVVVHRDPQRTVDAMVHAGFLAADHGLDPVEVYDYVSSPYRPYLVDHFTFTRDFVRDTLGRIMDVKGPHADVVARLNMPTSFVILDRVVWGVSAILGKLEASGPWRAMLLEYRTGAGPATPLGEAERAWLQARHR